MNIADIEKAIALSETPSELLPVVQGYSTPKVRQLLNSLVSYCNGTYLEIGLFAGSTFIPALYNHKDVFGIGIDNFEREDTRGMLSDNLKAHGIEAIITQQTTFDVGILDKKSKRGIQYDALIIDADYRSVHNLPLKADLYFYDGEHSREHQRDALTFYHDQVSYPLCYVVDDWDWGDVRHGTMDGINKSKLHVIKQWDLQGAYPELTQYWNGIGIFLLDIK